MEVEQANLKTNEQKHFKSMTAQQQTAGVFGLICAGENDEIDKSDMIEISITERNPEVSGVYKTDIGDRLYIAKGENKGWWNGIKPIIQIDFWYEKK